MMERATASAALAIVAGFALAQTQDLVFTQKNDEPSGTGTRGGLATAPHVGVGSDAVVVPANRRLAIYDKAANQLELWNIAASSPAFPFQADPLHGPDFGTMLFDPQAGYDPISNRLWMVYLEGTVSDTSTPGLGPEAFLHLAVSKDPADFGGGPLNTLADTHWHYYTHDTGTGTKAGAEYDLTLLPSPYLPYQGEFGHHPAEATVRMPSIGFDEQAIIVAVNESDKFFGADDNFPLYLTGDELYNTPSSSSRETTRAAPSRTAIARLKMRSH